MQKFVGVLDKYVEWKLIYLSHVSQPFQCPGEFSSKLQPIKMGYIWQGACGCTGISESFVTGHMRPSDGHFQVHDKK